MLLLKSDYDEHAGGSLVTDESRNATPAIHEYAPSTSVTSVELRTSFSISQERLLLTSLTELENKIANVSYGTRLPRPKGIELAPYRPQGIGVQATMFKSLIAEWSLFHNLPVVGVQLLEVAEPPPPQAKQSVFPLSPVLCHRQSQLTSGPLSVVGKEIEGLESVCNEEGAHGGFFDNAANDEDIFALPTSEEVMAVDYCAALPSILSDYTTEYDDMILSDDREPATFPNHTREALLHDVTSHTVSEVWASCVVPVLESLVPDKGVALVDHLVRSSTTNSVTTESSGINTSSACHQSKRPHTGGPRPLVTQSQSISWIPENDPSNHPPEYPYDTPCDDDEVCVYRTPPLPNGEEFNLNMNIVGTSGLRFEEQTTNSRRKDKNRRKAEKRRQRRRQKELQQQQNRISEYVAEQTAIGDIQRERVTPDLSLPPLYNPTDMRCGSTGSSCRRESNSRSTKGKPPSPPSPSVGGQEAEMVQELEVGQAGHPSGYPRESLCLPTLLCNKQNANPRYDWPTRAQTAIPSHARPLRLQQFPS